MEEFVSTRENFEAETNPQKPRKFLKRGEGIKKRFGIDPINLRIDNLPPYEYFKKTGKQKQHRESTKLQSRDASKLSAASPQNNLDQTPTVYNKSERRQFPLGWAKDLVSEHNEPMKIIQEQDYFEYSETIAPEHNMAMPYYSDVEEEEEEENSEYDEEDSDSESQSEENQVSNNNFKVHFESDTQINSYNQNEDNVQNVTVKPELCHQIEEMETQMNVIDSSNVYQYFNEGFLSDLQKRLCSMNNTDAQDSQQLSQQMQEQSNAESFDLSVNAESIRNHLAMLKEKLDILKMDHKKLLELQRDFTLKSKRLEKEHKLKMKKLEDDRMEFEIYMHDEKIKVEKEARKTDQTKLKLQKQVSELKKEVTNLQNQLQTKGKNSTVTEARLRAQMRAWQKERIQLQEQNKELKSIILDIVQQNGKTTNVSTSINKKLTPQLRMDKKNSNLCKMLQDQDHAKVTEVKKPNKVNNEKELKGAEARNFAVLELDDKQNEQKLAAKDITNSAETATQSCSEWQISKLEESTNKNKLTDFQRQIVHQDGSKEVYYTNGNRKEISADEMQVRMLYFNGDIKETNIDAGSIKYYYASQNIWHTTYLDGLEILEFPNGQVEHRHKDGLIEVHFPNDTVKIMNPMSAETTEEWHFPNGTKLQIQRNGDRILLLPNGQKEEQTKMGKRRVYPDGTVKLVYADGSQETRYSNGRIRIKDKYGQLIMDSNREFEN